MRPSQLIRIGCLAAALGLVHGAALAQFPGMGKMKRREPRKKPGADDGAQAQGIPVPADSPVFDAFRKLEGQSAYHQKMTITADDPQMQQMMSQIGFAPAEVTVAGDTKQVSMHFKLPALGQVEDFELRAVTRNGRVAKKWSSPASGRILKEQDASIAKQLAQAEEQSARSIAHDLASSGPLGLVSAGVSAAGAAANLAEAAKVKKQAHDFFEWSCMDGGAPAGPAEKREPPPLTDLRTLGDQSLDGTAVTAYEFFVRDGGGKFRGPVQLFVAKDSGLPLRVAMNDPRAGGGMHLDYYGFGQGDIEIPACLGERR